MSAEPFAVEIDPAGPARLVFRGRATVAAAAGLREAALGLVKTARNVGVDCRGAEQMDAAAIQVLVGLARDLAAAGRRCHVTGVSGNLAESFRLAGLGEAVAG